MRVKILAIDQGTGHESEARVADTHEVFGDDDDQRRYAEEELNTTGRYYAGGGAAPLFLLTRA